MTRKAKLGPITETELRELLERLCKRVGLSREFNEHARLPAIAESLAAELWIQRWPETTDTAMLRHQLQALRSPGFFDLVKDK